MCQVLILRWRVENYHRQQLRTALKDRSRSEHLQRREAGIKDVVFGGI
jgi:hypothetical protein